jgi:hypothetical protein
LDGDSHAGILNEIAGRQACRLRRRLGFCC